MSMGYFDQGMAALATSVLGVPVEKDRKVRSSPEVPSSARALSSQGVGAGSRPAIPAASWSAAISFKAVKPTADAALLFKNLQPHRPPPPYCVAMQVAVSNWEAERLSAAQISYAARDVLLTYHTHRLLRQWQAAGAQAPACQQCQRRLGTVSGICLVSMVHISLMNPPHQQSCCRATFKCWLLLPVHAVFLGAQPWAMMQEHHHIAASSSLTSHHPAGRPPPLDLPRLHHLLRAQGRHGGARHD